MMNASRLAAVAALALGAALPACKAPQPFGERHALIVHADSTLWAQIEPLALETLERRVFTTRPERTFHVTYVAPGDTTWNQFRLFWQVLVMGTPSDEIVADLVARSDDPSAQPPAIVFAADRWARAQLVAVMLLPERNTAAAARDLLPQLFAQLEGRYNDWVSTRMYTTGVNDSLRQALAGYGFTLDVPRVYQVSQRDSTFRFRNAYQAGDTDLMRSLLVTWRRGTTLDAPDSLLLWRERLAETQYDPAQDVVRENLRWDTVAVAGASALEMRGVFEDRTEYPAAGPFITRAIPCPTQDRIYYLDAWLYAPGADKHPYLRQLEILMGTFRCGGAITAADAPGPVEG